MKRAIIGVTGKAGSGKSTLCQAFKQMNCEVMNFADPLKRMLLWGFPGVFCEETLWGDSENRNLKVPYFNATIREVLQKLGTEGMRNQFNKNLWANYTVDYANEILSRNLKYNRITGRSTMGSEMYPVEGVVIGDCRFLNEAQAIRESGGYIVQVTRPSLVSNDTHQSETEMVRIKGDYIIVNDSTIGSLHLAAAKVLSSINMVAKR